MRAEKVGRNGREGFTLKGVPSCLIKMESFLGGECSSLEAGEEVGRERAVCIKRRRKRSRVNEQRSKNGGEGRSVPQRFEANIYI